MTGLQEAVNGELKDLGGALDSLDQSYSFAGHVGCARHWHNRAYTAGSSYNNCEEKCDDDCGDLVAADRSCPCQPCGSVVASASGCHQGCAGPWDGSAYLAGPRTVHIGVPRMKVTEWPSSPTITPEAHGYNPEQSDQAKDVDPRNSQNSYLNIPDSVW